MTRYGITREQMAAIPINQRRNAGMNPQAIYRDPITMDDYMAARMITTPFSILDCDVPCDGTTAVIVSRLDAARDLKQKPMVIEAVGAGAYDRDGKALGFTPSTAEKTYQSYRFVSRNPGGHSSRPRPDNAIYDLADSLKALEKHRFTPRLNETTRAYFAKRAQDEGDSPLGKAMRAWLANEQDGAAADAIEANEIEVGRTRTRCVATMLSGGHADNALPQRAEAVVNCRIIPGETPEGVMAELKSVVGTKSDVVYYDDFRGVPYYESIDLVDAFHPQTILAYAMNDADLPMGHGAPVRLRVERQLGYKHAKFVMRIEAVATLAATGAGRGGFWEDVAGYDWYAGI